MSFTNLFPYTHAYMYTHTPAVDCNSLPSPANGMVDLSPSTMFGSTAVYSCNEGYELNGINMRECESDGDWSLSAIPDPICEGMENKNTS